MASAPMTKIPLTFLFLASVGLMMTSSAPTEFHFDSAAPKVNVSLYFESLCESCGYFIEDQLLPTWEKVGEIMNVELLPFGNAKETKQGDKYVYDCQHGKEECEGNFVETCTIHYFPKVGDHLKFVSCFEKIFDFEWKKSLKTCAKKMGWPDSKVKDIENCVTGDEGWQLEHKVAQKTGPHNAVPWIMINGVHNQAQYNLTNEVCSLYTGPKPSGCTKLPQDFYFHVFELSGKKI